MFGAQTDAIYYQSASRVRSCRGGGSGGLESTCEEESEHRVPLSSTRKFGGQADVAGTEAKQVAMGCGSNVTAHHTRVGVVGVVDADGLGCRLLALVLLKPLEAVELVVVLGDAVSRRISTIRRWRRRLSLAVLLVLELGSSRWTCAGPLAAR